MKTAEEWIEQQSSNPPRIGSLEHKLMCDAVVAIQIDALKEAEEIVKAQKTPSGTRDWNEGYWCALRHGAHAILKWARELESSTKKAGE